MPDQDTALHFREARELARAIRAGELSSRQVTTHFLDRIARAPDLAAYSVVTAERALAQADAADRLLAAGISMGPLHGVPVAVKAVSYTHLDVYKRQAQDRGPVAARRR